MNENETMTEKKRAFELTLDIDATPEQVWKALTDAGELMRWFPLRAEVKPGQGGSMLWSWGKSSDWTSTIDAWEPGKLLRLVQEDYRPSEDVERSTVVMEFRLETRAGATRLRFVHSGFGRGRSWDNELDSISKGWPFELASLRVYLERFRGLDRRVGQAVARVEAPLPAVWARVLGPDGLRFQPAEPRKGDSFEATSPTGERLVGTMEMVIPGRLVTGVVNEMDREVLRVMAWPETSGKAAVGIWLVTYGDHDERIRKFRQATEAMLNRLFPPGK